MSELPKAPWKVGNEAGYNANIVYDADGHGVCQVYGIWQNTTVEKAANCEGMPVAMAISTMPELLASLRELVEAFETIDRRFTVPGWTVSDREALERARARIAKATGSER